MRKRIWIPLAVLASAAAAFFGYGPVYLEESMNRVEKGALLGISPEAEALCAARGVNFVQNRCPKIEYQRLFGELRMGGFNTGIISSKL